MKQDTQVMEIYDIVFKIENYYNINNFNHNLTHINKNDVLGFYDILK